MWIEPNTVALSGLARAQSLKRPFAEIQSWAINANTLSIDPDQSIYRIAELVYVEQDIKDKVLTYKSILPKSWGDDYENPLYGVLIPTPWGDMSLKAMLGDYFAVCWSAVPVAPEGHWHRFSYSEPAVRLKSTPRLLLEQLMEEADEYISLRHFVGSVRYEAQGAIDVWVKSVIQNYSQLMDGQGLRIAQSLMLLRSDFGDEHEVRVLCSSLKNSQCTWWKDRVRIDKGRPKLPFNWSAALTGIELGPAVNRTSEQNFRSLLFKQRIACPLTRTFP